MKQQRQYPAVCQDDNSISTLRQDDKFQRLDVIVSVDTLVKALILTSRDYQYQQRLSYIVGALTPTTPLLKTLVLKSGPQTLLSPTPKYGSRLNNVGVAH